MPRKYIVILVVAVIGYVLWRKFGESIKSTVSSVTA